VRKLRVQKYRRYHTIKRDQKLNTMQKLVAILKTSFYIMTFVALADVIIAVCFGLSLAGTLFLLVLTYSTIVLPGSVLLVGVSAVIEDAEREENEILLLQVRGSGDSL
jgi:hypothetical protein